MKFNKPLRCVIGTIGLPGERTFFWQIKNHREVISIKLEKQQAAVIAEQLETLLDEMLIETGWTDPHAGADRDPLELPIDDFVNLVSVGIYIDGDLVRFDVGTNDDDDTTNLIQVFLTKDGCREFVDRTKSVVAAGRRSCPFCSNPLEISGHICVRANGYRR